MDEQGIPQVTNAELIADLEAILLELRDRLNNYLELGVDDLIAADEGFNFAGQLQASRAPARGPLGPRAIAGSKRAARHLERRLLVFLEIEAQPAGGEAAVTVRLLPCDQCRQLERLGDRHSADLSSRHLGGDKVAAFQRSSKDRSRVALRGRRSLLSGAERRDELSVARCVSPPLRCTCRQVL
jgi:hypothetical protein